MSMRGIYTSVNDIRKRVFAEVARLSYNYQDGDLSEMELIPYRIIPGEVSTYRESVFLERAIGMPSGRVARCRVYDVPVIPASREEGGGIFFPAQFPGHLRKHKVIVGILKRAGGLFL